MLPGPFAYAERWDEAAKAYRGVAIEKSLNVPVVVDSESVIIMPDVALAYISAQAPVGSPLLEATASRNQSLAQRAVPVHEKANHSEETSFRRALLERL